MSFSRQTGWMALLAMVLVALSVLVPAAPAASHQSSNGSNRAQHHKTQADHHKKGAQRHKLGVRRSLRRAATGARIDLGQAKAVSKKRKRSKSGGEAATSGSRLSFRAEHLSDFWLRQSAPGALSEVPDPAGSGQTVFRSVVSDNDVYPVTPTENPRAEMLSPSEIVAGDEFWWRTKFFLPPEFPSSLNGWLNVLQGPYGEPFNGSPPWQIQVNGDKLQWSRNRTYDYDVPWRAPLVRGSWVSVLVHERFAADGWVEMWINGAQVTFFSGDSYNPDNVAPTTRLAMQTMDSSNNGSTNSIYLQSYRRKGMLQNTTVYHGPLVIGTSQAEVES
jgi:hypothetical protein